MAHAHAAGAGAAASVHHHTSGKWQGLGGLITILIALHVVAVVAWIWFTASDARAAKNSAAQHQD
jgi:cyanate permease